MLAARVQSALNVRFQGGGSKPNVLFTDRGAGFYASRGGKITPQYNAALAEHSLQAYNGDDGSKQPGNLQEVLLHETAVSWIRHRERTSRVICPWKESTGHFIHRLREAVQHINDNHGVEGLCRGLPKRLDDLAANDGDRLSY